MAETHTVTIEVRIDQAASATAYESGKAAEERVRDALTAAGIEADVSLAWFAQSDEYDNEDSDDSPVDFHVGKTVL